MRNRHILLLLRTSFVLFSLLLGSFGFVCLGRRLHGDGDGGATGGGEGEPEDPLPLSPPQLLAFMGRSQSRKKRFTLPLPPDSVPCVCVHSPSKEYTFIVTQGIFNRVILSNRAAVWRCRADPHASFENTLEEGGGLRGVVCKYDNPAGRLPGRPLCVEGLPVPSDDEKEEREVAKNDEFSVESLESSFVLAVGSRQKGESDPSNACASSHESLMYRMYDEDVRRYEWVPFSVVYSINFRPSLRLNEEGGGRWEEEKMQRYVRDFARGLNYRVVGDRAVTVLEGFRFDGRGLWEIQVTFFAAQQVDGRLRVPRLPLRGRADRVHRWVVRQTQPSVFWPKAYRVRRTEAGTFLPELRNSTLFPPLHTPSTRLYEQWRAWRDSEHSSSQSLYRGRRDVLHEWVQMARERANVLWGYAWETVSNLKGTLTSGGGYVCDTVEGLTGWSLSFVRNLFGVGVDPQS
uniref:Uncharacterized protein n=1 Tax=Chromera velia CCMP2878 TaxID=1169474 RepID=A0A0G4FS08_9ALVE|eukprot:Cvel_3666.t1-p1 / transcript=Cvel_3666.t1 / gene=Cvel_3666 / organism=Chromera_velia_CCMP2878 / gene_product=hypothetical protein / transcript_product=hypothetical protein / location=Cvel_scaffold152:62114-64909(-) / protein_length=459 / sequence_SO=supercontig / SO=protein_coding / is_pseudo=false